MGRAATPIAPEAIRDLARSGLQQHAMQAAGRQRCVAALIYVYDHHSTRIAKAADPRFPRSS